MREEPNVVSSTPTATESHSQATPAEPTANAGSAPFDVARLIQALIACAILVGAAIAYEAFG